MMTGIWAIVPLKPLTSAKSRLASVLAPHERQQLAETLFRRVLDVLRGVPQLAGTLVISRDPRALAIARDYGAKTVQESGAPELNAALLRATSLVAVWRGKGVLILPADLPLITAEDVTAMIDMAQGIHSVVIATDRNHDGTNAMLVKPPGLIDYAYGIGSFQRHLSRAEVAGARVYCYESERLALDLDVPEDLALYERFMSIDR
jgi:2-phospho-L-lactate guanylyltransferase